MRRTGYLGLGSNVGDPAAHLRAAIELLPGRGVEVEAVSSACVTEPVGEVLDQPDFLNAAIRIRTETVERIAGGGRSQRSAVDGVSPDGAQGGGDRGGAHRGGAEEDDGSQF